VLPAHLQSLFDIVFLMQPVATYILGGLKLDSVPNKCALSTNTP
jgi:hypothetical protein